MQHWGIDAGVFPKSADLILINGYHGLVDQSAQAILKILSNFGWWTLGACFVALYLFVLISPWDAGIGRAWGWLARRSSNFQRLVRCFVETFALAAFIPFLLFAWTLIMYFPDAIGAANGQQSAEREAAEFAKGCERSKFPCVELKKGDQLLGSGFVLDGSPTFVAIFDPQRRRARVVPRDGVELISGRAPTTAATLKP